MKIRIEKSIQRDLKKIADPLVNAQVESVYLAVKAAVSPKDIPELRKLQGSKKGIHYRIRVGDYRIGVTIEGDLVTFVRCKLRKNAYKKTAKGV